MLWSLYAKRTRILSNELPRAYTDNRIEGRLYVWYFILLYSASMLFFPTVFKGSYNGLLFKADISVSKCVIACIIGIVVLYTTKTRYASTANVTQTIMLLLALLYFLPGLVLCGVLNCKTKYYIAYTVFMSLVYMFDAIIPHPQKNKSLLQLQHRKFNFQILVALSFLTVPFMAIIFNKSLSLSSIIFTITNPYDVRAVSSAQNTHWLIIAVEQWAVYFGAIMITYYIKKRKIGMACAYIICELFFFTLQGNRIDLFITIIAIIAGFVNMTSKRIALGCISLMSIVWIECAAKDTGGIITDVFRRFSIVPNRLGANYFDYFQTHEADWLRETFSRTSGIFGLESPFADQSIERTIGYTYYGWAMGANTGLIGSAMYLFGNVGIILEPMAVVFFLRLLEKCTLNISDRSITLVVAVVFTVLLINAPAPLANCFKPSYYLMLLISLAILNAKEKCTVKSTN